MILRRLRWFVRNWDSYKLVAIQENGVHVLIVEDGDVRGCVVVGPAGDALRQDIDVSLAEIGRTDQGLLIG